MIPMIVSITMIRVLTMMLIIIIVSRYCYYLGCDDDDDDGRDNHVTMVTVKMILIALSVVAQITVMVFPDIVVT